MEETSRKTKFAFGRIPVQVIVFACFLLVAGAVYLLFSNITHELYKERAYHLQETTLTIAEKVDVVLDDRWNTLESAEKLIAASNLTDTASVNDALANTESILPTENSTLVLIDNKRTCFNNEAKGGTQIWIDTDLLLSGEKRQIALEDQTLDGIGATEYMVFMLKFDNPMSYGDGSTSLTHIALIQPVDMFKDIFRASVYNKQNQTIILNSDGTRVYFDGEDSLFTGYNVFTALNDATFKYDVTLESFREASTNDTAATAEIDYEGTTYFIACTELEGGWQYLAVVPEQYVSANSTGFIGSVVWSFAFFIVLLVVVAMALTFFITVARNRKQQVEREQEANRKLNLANRAAREAEIVAREAEAKAINASAAKSDFLSNMSHDIRTPINGIIGMLDIADLHRDNHEEVLGYLDRIRGVTNHLLTLINDVLDMSKAESGKVELAHEAFDMQQLLGECTDIIKGQMQERNLAFNENLSGLAHRYLYGSPLHLRRIVLNILGNAVKYTEDGGHITFIADELASENTGIAQVRIVVADDGIGMSEEFQKEIFEPFTRADNTNSSELRGTGLGMAITKNLVDLMGGTIEVASKLGEGSTFTVVLPLEINEAAAKGTSTAASAITGIAAAGAAGVSAHSAQAGAPQDIAGYKLLLVEDNELNREIAKTLLEEKGAIITEAVNGQEALDTFNSNPAGTFDAILMDVMMPVMDGLDATRAIRALAREDAAQIPIIAMTANAFAEDVAAAKEAGMNEHLAKPLNFDVVAQVLGRYVTKQ